MNESTEEMYTRKPSLRKRVGRVLFFLGLTIMIISLIGPTVHGLVFGLLTEVGYILNTMGIGVLFSVAGLLVALYPEGKRGENDDGWSWTMMMSPFAGNN